MGNENISTKYKILQSLRQAKQAISGENLAKENGISRTSVWKAVQSLQDAGYKIESMGSGYLLVKDLKDSLFPYEFGQEEQYFTHFKTTESTMIQARKIAESEKEDKKNFPFRIVTADSQTKGRGQKGRNWKTTRGSLAFTLITKDEKPLCLSGRTVMAAQIALCNCLNKFGSKKFFLRWPNDIWTADGKVAGILDELFSSGSICSWQNLGIGVNIFTNPDIEKSDCVFSDKKNAGRKDILLSFCQEFKTISAKVQKEDSELTSLWNSLCMDLNKKIRLKSNSKEYVFKGIDAYGSGILSFEEERKILAAGCDSYIK